MSEYGCLIQVGPDKTRHFVSGEDALKALFHSIICIELNLMVMSCERVLTNIDGTAFDIKQEGFLSGSLAAAYSSQLNLAQCDYQQFVKNNCPWVAGDQD